MFRTGIKLLLVLALFSDFFGAAAQQSGFVRRQGMHLFENSRRLYYIGTNYWYGALPAIAATGSVAGNRLIEELEFLKQNGITNLRILAGAEGSGLVNGIERVGPPLQPAPGIFDSTALQALDLLLTEMAKRHLKAVIYFSNNWEWSGGFLQYLNWNGLPDSVMRRRLSWDENRDIVSRFYDCTACSSAYITQVRKIVQRVNSITGKRYADDATIMSWEIANEPRPMRPAAISSYKKWVREVAASIKAIDKKHLVTIGTEGYIGTETLDVYREIHEDQNIDYLTIHIWPKNWDWFQVHAFENGMDTVFAKTRKYIEDHLAIANILKKPLVIEEFGLPRDGHSYDVESSTSLRDKYYQQIFDALISNMQNNGALAGVNFWAFGGLQQPVEVKWQPGHPYTGDPPMEEQGLNSVFVQDHTTWDLIQRYSKLIAATKNRIITVK